MDQQVISDEQICLVLKQVQGDRVTLSANATTTMVLIVEALLEKLCQQIQDSTPVAPITATQVISALKSFYPDNILMKHAVAEATKAVTVSSTKPTGGLNYNHANVAEHIKERLNIAVDASAGFAAAAILEYMTAEIGELSGNNAVDAKSATIENNHINAAINDDEELLAWIEKAGIILAE